MREPFEAVKGLEEASMDLMLTEGLGLIAGCMTTCSFIPQVVRTYRTRSVSDISLSMYLLFCSGVAMWIVYGVLIGSVAVTAANVVSLVLSASILAMKLRYGKEAGKPDKDENM